MKELKLDPALLEIAIEGQIYPFRADSAFAERVAELAGEAERRSAMASAEDRNDPVETAAFLSYAVDSLLGDGTVEAIFGEDIPEILPLLDILDGIMTVFCDYRAARIAKLKEGMA
jgi:hypothetical protein